MKKKKNSFHENNTEKYTYDPFGHRDRWVKYVRLTETWWSTSKFWSRSTSRFNESKKIQKNNYHIAVSENNANRNQIQNHFMMPEYVTNLRIICW